MLPIFNNKSRNSDGRLNVLFRPSGGIPSSYMRQGWSLDPATMMPYVEFSGLAVPSTAVRYQGIAFTTDGAMYITTAPFLNTTSFRINGGVAVRFDGAVHIAPTQATVGTKIQGQALGVNGELLLSDSFIASFSDLGSGAVNTVIAGTGNPTFTRATVAWTKLSTGLWASVASGTARSCYIGADTAVGGYGGYFAEPAATQLVTPDASIRDMTNAAWTAGATMTVAKDGVGIDGVANSCSRLTGGAVEATNTILQTLTAAASTRTYSVWLKRVTGTGAVSLTQDSGVGWTDVTSSLNTSTFTRVSLTASQLNAAFGIRVSVSTDVVLADFNQFEAGAFATSPLATAGAVRNADVLTYVFAGNASATAGYSYSELYGFWSTAQAIQVAIGFAGATETPMATAAAAAATFVRMRDGTNNADKSGLTSMATAVRKRASSWGAAGMAITGDGAAPGTSTFDGSIGSTAIGIGCTGAGGSQWYGTIKNVMIGLTQPANSTLQLMTL